MSKRVPRGAERRHHVVYVTCNTEYHCRDAECVGVRDRCSGRWQRAHPALRGRLVGGVAREKPAIQTPEAGLRLVFSAKQAVVTSPLMVTGRPDREAVFFYTSLCRAGEITLPGDGRSRATG